MKKLLTIFTSFLVLALFSATASASSISSVQTGTWNTTTTWTGGIVPGSSDDVTIAAGHTVTLDVSPTVNSCTVAGTGILDASTFTLTVNGAFTLQSNASFKQGGSVTTLPGASQSFASTSTYIFNGTQNTLPAATYGNLTWSSPANASISGPLTVNGDLTLLNCGELRGTNAGAKTHNVAGSVDINGSSAVLVGASGGSAGTSIWNITGNVTTENSGVLKGQEPTNSASSTYNIGGNFINNGSFNIGGGSGVITLAFDGGSAQNVTGNAFDATNVTINNSTGVTFSTVVGISGTLALVSGTLTNTSNLTLYGGGSTTIARTAGTLGSVPTFPAGINITYLGNVTTGNELPTAVGDLGDLTIHTSGTVTLAASATVNGALTLTSGNVNLGGKTLTLGNSVGSPGTLTYTAGYMTGTGTFTRWIGLAAISGTAGTFPMGVGTSNRSLQIGGTPAAGGTVSVSYNDASTVSTPFGPSFSENSQTFVNRYDANWVVAQSGLTWTAITLAIRGDGMPGITNVADLNVSGATAIAPGVYAAPGGTPAAPVINRSGLTQDILPGTYYFASTSTSPLPVEITSFTALAGKNSVELAWNTATEVNNYGFDIERKTANSQQLTANNQSLTEQGTLGSAQSTINNWTKVGFVNGHGTTNAPQNYAYTDASVSVGKYSYRLKQIDHNGNFVYSKTVEVTVSLMPGTIWLDNNYPNPFNPSTKISFVLGTKGHATLKVYSLLGQEVATLADGEFNDGEIQTFTFDASKLSSGIYYYQLKSGNGTQIKKMMLLK